jgi:hypothetical protein
MEQPRPRTREVTIVAHDPSIRDAKGKILRQRIVIPDEELIEDPVGPTGYRVTVIDFDASAEAHYKPWPRRKVPATDPRNTDPYRRASDRQILGDPGFHCFNVYALVMRTLARFEFALGRRISWGFSGHQIKVAPHAFAEANAFYSERDNALMFGYFPRKDGQQVFTCLSHDVIVHETTHALLDGLRERYTDPSSEDQAAFHEGFSDVVALLSVFSMPSVVERMLELHPLPGSKNGVQIPVRSLTAENLRKSVLFGLADEVGQEIDAVRGRPLRESLKIEPRRSLYGDPKYEEPHLRGELLVVAMLNGFVKIWSHRLTTLGDVRSIDRSRVIEEGAELADTLLTSAIRALDYAPPVDITFRDYLSAFLTGDQEIRPSDEKYDLRRKVLQSFRACGITPPEKAGANGTWPQAPAARFDRVHFEPMQRDFQEMFHFIWENRKTLQLHDEGFTRVLSVRPVQRIGPDGFSLRETVCEFHQRLDLLAGELRDVGLTKPDKMPSSENVTLYGGGTLIFNEYGSLKYAILNPLTDRECQNRRLESLWKQGALGSASLRFANLHRQRAVSSKARREEEW